MGQPTSNRCQCEREENCLFYPCQAEWKTKTKKQNTKNKQQTAKIRKFKKTRIGFSRQMKLSNVQKSLWQLASLNSIISRLDSPLEYLVVFLMAESRKTSTKLYFMIENFIPWAIFAVVLTCSTNLHQATSWNSLSGFGFCPV